MMTGVRRDGDLTLVGDNRVILGCREKPRRDGASRPYPKPTQVVGQSMPRRTSESWLRNSAKCPRNFGRRGALSVICPCGGERVGVAETRGKRLFIKNTGPCEVVRRGIRTDSCPVLEG